MERRENRLYGDEHPRQDYQREDTRWEGSTPARDWLVLLTIGVLHLAWMLAVYFLEPGIR